MLLTFLCANLDLRIGSEIGEGKQTTVQITNKNCKAIGQLYPSAGRRQLKALDIFNGNIYTTVGRGGWAAIFI